ncbi:MAG: RNA polymerase-binding protein DksA [Desulfobacteraceae bacterium]|nr:RNA polymerase-binding protein DksA [Desulfobacteraceae bacterium]
MNDDLPKEYRPSEDEPYMNPRQLEYFRRKLVSWHEELLSKSANILDLIEEKSLKRSDVLDQGTLGANMSVELRTGNSYLKLLKKIDDALERIKDGTFGYCEETGEEIGIKRLEARPVATLSIEAQKRHEQKEKIRRSGHRRCRH